MGCALNTRQGKGLCTKNADTKYMYGLCTAFDLLGYNPCYSTLVAIGLHQGDLLMSSDATCIMTHTTKQACHFFNNVSG